MVTPPLIALRVLYIGYWCNLVYLEGHISTALRAPGSSGLKEQSEHRARQMDGVSVQLSPCTLKILKQCSAQAVSAEKDFHKVPVLFGHQLSFQDKHTVQNVSSHVSAIFSANPKLLRLDWISRC